MKAVRYDEDTRSRQMDRRGRVAQHRRGAHGLRSQRTTLPRQFVIIGTTNETVARIGATTKTVKHAPARGLTVRGFVTEWLPKRRERGLDWKADEGRLNRHVLPYIGDLLIAEVRARHLIDVFHKLRTDPNLNLAPRSIYNITRRASRRAWDGPECA